MTIIDQLTFLSFSFFIIMIIVGTVRRTKTHNFTKQTFLDLISNTIAINIFALRLHATLINSLEESRNNNNFQHVFNIGYLCLHDGNGIPHTFIFEVLTKVSKIWYKTLRNVVSIYREIIPGKRCTLVSMYLQKVICV